MADNKYMKILLKENARAKKAVTRAEEDKYFLCYIYNNIKRKRRIL